MGDRTDGILAQWQDAMEQWQAGREGKPLKPKSQWDRCEYWRQHLESDAADGDTVAAGILEDWENVADAGGVPAYRGAELRRLGRTPLDALFGLLGPDHFQYPPPELLLALRDAWRRYAAAQGKLTLEQAFFGPPVPRAGNYASRSGAAQGKAAWQGYMTHLLSEGMSRTEAAEVIADGMNASQAHPVDVETVLRTIKPYRPRRPHKPEK